MGKLNKAKWCLLGCLIVVLVLVGGSASVPDKVNNAVQFVGNNDLACKLRGLSKQQAAMDYTLIEMVVQTVGVSKVDHQPVVILKEKGGELYLTIWIGLIEANSISVTLEGLETSRPLTPDLLCSMIDRMGASVDRIIINDLREQTFYAQITIDANCIQMEFDARPSDAIAIALRVEAPIYVEKAVLDEAGIQPDYKTW